jgi:hypothetical protein
MNATHVLNKKKSSKAQRTHTDLIEESVPIHHIGALSFDDFRFGIAFHVVHGHFKGSDAPIHMGPCDRYAEVCSLLACIWIEFHGRIQLE